MTTTETREIPYWRAHSEALAEAMRRDPTIIMLGEDIAGGGPDTEFTGAWGSPFGTTRGLVQEFGPERVRDTPISEAGFLGAAIGLATAGYRPWVDVMFTDLMGVCFDEIMIQMSRLRYHSGGQVKIPLVLKMWMTGSGILSSLLVHIPGIKVVTPSNPYNGKGLIIAALEDDDPVIYLDNQRFMVMRTHVPEGYYTVPIGKAEVTKEGKDVTIVGYSAGANDALEAAKQLQGEGIEAEVVDLLSLSPLDEEAVLASVHKTHRLVVVDEDYPRCSVATDIAALAADRAYGSLQAPIKMVTSLHAPPTRNPGMRDAYWPSPAKIADAVRSIVK